MRRLLPSAALCLLAAAAAHAGASPQAVDFQGKLLDSSNNPRNGSYNITFNLYNVPTGGTALWTETHNGVSVNNGLFSVALGGVTALTSDLFGGASAYLEIQVGTDPAMTPREQLLMTPIAFRALVADQLQPGNTSYIQVSQTLQSGAAFNVSSATVAGPFQANGSSTFTASGAQTYSLVASSGVLVQNGTLNVQGSGGVFTPNAVQAATVSATTGLILPQGPVDTTVGSLRWNATTNLVSIGTGTANKTLADTDSFQTLTNKTLNSTGNQVIDATHLRTRAVAAAAPADRQVLSWDASASNWTPNYITTMTVFYTSFPTRDPVPALGWTNGRIYLIPIVLPGELTLNQMRIAVVTADAAAVGDMGLYSPGGNLIAHSGASSISFNVAVPITITKAVTPAGVVLRPGMYFLAITGTSNGLAQLGGLDFSAAANPGIIRGLGFLAGGGTTLPASINTAAITDGTDGMFFSLNQ